MVRVYSRDIGMEFGIDKCAVLVLKAGVKTRCDGISLPDGQVMKEVDEQWVQIFRDFGRCGY